MCERSECQVHCHTFTWCVQQEKRKILPWTSSFFSLAWSEKLCNNLGIPRIARENDTRTLLVEFSSHSIHMSRSTRRVCWLRSPAERRFSSNEKKMLYHDYLHILSLIILLQSLTHFTRRHHRNVWQRAVNFLRFLLLFLQQCL